MHNSSKNKEYSHLALDIKINTLQTFQVTEKWKHIKRLHPKSPLSFATESTVSKKKPCKRIPAPNDCCYS